MLPPPCFTALWFVASLFIYQQKTASHVHHQTRKQTSKTHPQLKLSVWVNFIFHQSLAQTVYTINQQILLMKQCCKPPCFHLNILTTSVSARWLKTRYTSSTSVKTSFNLQHFLLIVFHGLFLFSQLLVYASRLLILKIMNSWSLKCVLIANSDSIRLPLSIFFFPLLLPGRREALHVHLT